MTSGKRERTHNFLLAMDQRQASHASPLPSFTSFRIEDILKTPVKNEHDWTPNVARPLPISPFQTHVPNAWGSWQYTLLAPLHFLPSTPSYSCLRADPRTFNVPAEKHLSLFKVSSNKIGLAPPHSWPPFLPRPLPKRKGGQVRFSTDQTAQLEQRFEQQKYLTPPERRSLAKILDLSERQVKTWFQNRRAKWRRLKQEMPTNGSSNTQDVSKSEQQQQIEEKDAI